MPKPGNRKIRGSRLNRHIRETLSFGLLGPQIPLPVSSLIAERELILHEIDKKKKSVRPEEMIRIIRTRDVEPPVIRRFINHLAESQDPSAFRKIFEFVLKHPMYQSAIWEEARLAAKDAMKKISNK